MVSYSEFSKLRLRDFYPEGEALFREDRGFECALGFSGYEGDVATYFAWPVNRPDMVGEMFLSFRDGLKECPEALALEIMKAIKLSLHPRMPREDVLAVLGVPYHTEDCPQDVTAFDFDRVGEEGAKYKVRCYLHAVSGLVGLQVVRRDLLESFDEI